MVRGCLVGLFLLSACAPDTGVVLTPEEEARRIYQLVRAEEAALVALNEMHELMAAQAQKAARDLGKELSNSAADYFVELILREATPAMVSDLKSETVKLYVETYSPQSLHAYRVFLETPEGDEIAAKQADLMKELFATGEIIGEKAGLLAAQKIVDNIQNDIWPVEGDDNVKAELKAWIGQSENPHAQ